MEYPGPGPRRVGADRGAPGRQRPNLTRARPASWHASIGVGVSSPGLHVSPLPLPPPASHSTRRSSPHRLSTECNGWRLTSREHRPSLVVVLSAATWTTAAAPTSTLQ